MREENKIEKTVRSSLKEEPEPMELDKEWLKLESQLEVKEFFTFRWNRFNVYYLASFVASLGMAASALYLALSLDTAAPRQQVWVQTDTLYVDRIVHDTLVVYQNGRQKAVTSLKKEGETIQNAVTQNVPKEITPPKAEESSAPKAAETPVPESKKIVYQYKRDTIVKFDSVKVSKRQWKKMQKAK